jgi:hypothetical protein
LFIKPFSQFYRTLLTSLLAILLSLLVSSSLLAQDTSSVAKQSQITKIKATAERLKAMQSTLKALSTRQREISLLLKKADVHERSGLIKNKEDIEKEIRNLNTSFEQIAIGGIDLDIFGKKEEKFDWQAEIIGIMQPLIENLKVLTEKPRKIERLRNAIEKNREQASAINEAIESLADDSFILKRSSTYFMGP